MFFAVGGLCTAASICIGLMAPCSGLQTFGGFLMGMAWTMPHWCPPLPPSMFQCEGSFERMIYDFLVACAYSIGEGLVLTWSGKAEAIAKQTCSDASNANAAARNEPVSEPKRNPRWRSRGIGGGDGFQQN